MPESESPVSLIVNTLAAGEISPDLYGRTDLAKFHQGSFLMRNFFVNYKGGTSSRPGTQFIGNPVATGKARLWPFQFSADIGQTYMLVFTAGKLQFIKNPGGLAYPNGSNAGWIISGGSPYTVNTPYAEVDLPFLKFSQTGDILTITRKGYVRQALSRISDTNWTLASITEPTIIAAPLLTTVSVTPLPGGSVDPQNTYYQYAITAVDANGNESVASNRRISAAGINIATTQGTVTSFWNAVSGAAYYKVYKALPTTGGAFPSYAEQLGFVGFSYGTQFTDTNIVPDFSKSPLRNVNPFVTGAITGYAISASSNDWPIATTTLAVSDANGHDAVVYPVFDVNSPPGAAGHIVGIVIEQPGFAYTAPTITASGGGTTFTASLTLSPSGSDPDVVGLFQQRQVYAASINKPSTIWGSRVSFLDDFRASNPTVDSDAYSFTIASQQINNVVWLQSMPGGLVIGTNSGIVQLTGGSASASNPLAVTGSSAVIVPQSYYGSADLHPIVIDYDILYVQAEGGTVRDLQYNFFVNIYTGTDITTLSSHLFYPLTIVDWAYQDTPFKVVWAVRSDGVLLSLTYLKGQEILGWAHHDLSGFVEAVGCVREGSVDAVYISVLRGTARYIERLCDKQFAQIDDAWCLDAALNIPTAYKNAQLSISALTGNGVNVVSLTPIFNIGQVNGIIRAGPGKGVITAFISSTNVTMNVSPGYDFPGLTILANTWRLDSNVNVVSGLAHLNTFSVMALVDGVPQGPFTVSGGSINLSSPGSAVVVGLPFTAQLQPLYTDIAGEKTIQGKRKKVAAVSVRVKDAAGLKMGPDFDHLITWKQGISSTDPAQTLPYKASGLTTGDQRIIINQTFNVVGTVCIQQDNPLPATILAIIPEIVMGDT